jgi:hypothetical protein
MCLQAPGIDFIFNISQIYAGQTYRANFLNTNLNTIYA